MDSVAPQAHGRFVVDDHGVAVTPATMDAGVVVRSTIIAALALATAACATPAALDTAQAPLCSQRVQTRLFFGLEAPDGRVPDTAWQAFVDEAVTPRFGEGLTVFEARGQWRDASGVTVKEPSRIVAVIHADSPTYRRHLTEIVDTYKTRFHQQAVLWTQVPVRACA